MSARKSYPVSFKREALKKLDENSNNISKTAQEIDVTRKMICDWKKKSIFILSGDFDRNNRRIGRG